MSDTITLPNRRFLRHYLEMVAAMMLGMVILGAPLVAALAGLGTSMGDLRDEAPALLLVGMAVTMTVPMVGWMMYRGHATRLNVEMAAAMNAPTVAVVLLLGAGTVTDLGALMLIEHVAMPITMLAAMLARREEYERCH